MGMLRHELPDQQVLDHPIIANGLIALLVTMSCRLSLRRVASRGVLPRERFSPLARSCRSGMSAQLSLSGGSGLLVLNVSSSRFVKGFGCRPLEGRRRLFGGRRPKASKGGNRAGGT